MENINWIDLTMAGLTLISVIASIFVLVGSQKDAKDTLSAEHGKLTTEHDRLTTEHDRLTTEHSKLSGEHQTIIKQYIGISDDLKFLRDAENKNQVRMESMTKPEVDTESIVNTLNDMLDFSRKQGEELKKYMELYENLKIENTKLKAENLKLRRLVEIREEAEI